MKRLISLLLIIAGILCALAGCNGNMNNQENGESTEEGGESTEEGGESSEGGNTVLDGKKIIFIGNSFTHYGNVVIRKGQTVQSQTARKFDRGYFYQICKKNGANVNVTNWCYGGHDLSSLFEVCKANRGCDGVIHKDDIVDRNYDYVVMQQGSLSKDIPDFLDKCDMVMNFFKEANPNVKFIFLVHEQAHTTEYVWLSEVKELEKKGVTIVDWGKLVYDLINGNVSVPNATQIYNKNSFIVCKSEKDGYHPNLLTGYITALMTYCAITGESAVGQDYSFCNNSGLDVNFDFDRFKSLYYTYNNPTTNFAEIFESPSDMEGIQRLIDKYIEDKPYLNY